MRLQKFLAHCGIASRRKCEDYIKDGRVSVNGKIIREMGYKIDPNKDKVFFDGRLVGSSEKKVYLALNKPKGVITSVKDEFGRKTVLDLVKVKERIYPVGRLDWDTEGLLILTNDGDFAFYLTHPKHEIPKTYIAEIKGKPTIEEIERFKNGLVIDGYKTSKADFKILKDLGKNTLVEITIWEGRNRQVRKMCEKIGHPVINLKRTKIGNLSLKGLGLGKYRYLTREEVRKLGGNHHG